MGQEHTNKERKKTSNRLDECTGDPLYKVITTGEPDHAIQRVMKGKINNLRCGSNGQDQGDKETVGPPTATDCITN